MYVQRSFMSMFQVSLLTAGSSWSMINDSLGWCIWIRLLLHQRNCFEGTFGRYRRSQSSRNKSLQNRRSFFLPRSLHLINPHSPNGNRDHQTFDLLTVTKADLNFIADFKLTATRNDYIHAFLGWFDVSFRACHKAVSFSTGPHAKYTHWKRSSSSFPFSIDLILTPLLILTFSTR